MTGPTYPPVPPADPPRKNWNANFTIKPYRGKDGEHRFAIVASNGEIVASGEGYAREIDMLTTLRRLFPEAEI